MDDDVAAFLEHSENTDLCRVGAEAALRGKALSADVAVEGAVLGSLHLGVVVPQVLLEVGQLDEGAAAVGQVAFVWTLA